MHSHRRMREKGSTRRARAPLATPRIKRVRDVMRRDFITISPEESVAEALQLMRLARLRHLAVVNEGVLVGILSYRDLQDALISNFDRESPASVAADVTKIGGVERTAHSPYSIVPDATLAEAASRLELLRVGCLPVAVPAESGLHLVGLLTELDLLRAAYGI
jgi:acetoin utilization protein AcuB